MSTDGDRQTMGFQAEVRQLLGLMVNSLYSNKEIFLRELISNASDAADKLRFEALGDDALYEGSPTLAIHVGFDKRARTVTVSDNGIGMSRDEIVENLGTIARSGTRRFFESLTGDAARDAQLIGQFGVGFYSAFIVADRVTVTSRRAGLEPEAAVRWESDGEGEYTVETVHRAERGTEVVLHLKRGESEFLDHERLKGVLRRYSDHISLPILMVDPQDTKREDAVNRATALWTRNRKEIDEDEYHEFYKHVARDFEAPLGYVHTRVEGKLEYTSLLFVPARAPFDLWDREGRRGIKLYVRRVFIMEDAQQLMPAYLRFVRGVVDCADLPLNISREILQRDKQIEAIRTGSVKRILGLLERMEKKEAEKYGRFWKEFGRVLKEGIVEDAANRERLTKLLRFSTTRSESDTEDPSAQSVSLQDYVARMREDQKEIYYLTADDLHAARSSPHLEVFRARDIEVLLLVDPIDEWVVNHLTEHEGRPLRSVAKGDLDLGALGEEAETGGQDDGAGIGDLAERIRSALDGRVREVRASRRLTTSPACLVAAEHELGGNLERILQAAGQPIEASVPVLELNPSHPVIRRLAAGLDGERLDQWADLLFDQALIAEGGRPRDPARFVRRLNELYLSLAPAGEQPGSGDAKPDQAEPT